MAKKGYRTCNVCRQSFKMEEMIQVNSSRYMCKVCYEEKGKESKDYKLLIEYICQIFRLDKPTGLILNQIKKYHNLGYTYGGIAYTLDYYLNVEKKKLDKVTIGIVPYYYEQARQHSVKIRNAELSVSNATKCEPKVVSVSKMKTPNRFKNTRFIDISKL